MIKALCFSVFILPPLRLLRNPRKCLCQMLYIDGLQCWTSWCMKEQWWRMMFAQAALCLSGRHVRVWKTILMLYREYRYSIEKEPRSADSCHILRNTDTAYGSFYFCVCNRVNTASVDQYDRVEFLCFKFTVDQVRTHLLPVLFFCVHWWWKTAALHWSVR